MEPGAEPRSVLVGTELGRDVPAVHAVLRRQPDAQRHDRVEVAAAEAVGVISRLAAIAACIPFLIAGLLARPAALQTPRAAPPADGAALFADHFSGCPNNDDARGPSAEVLHGGSPQAIIDALTSGSMKYQGLALSGEERRAIAETLTGRKLRGALAGSTVGNCGSSTTVGTGRSTRLAAGPRRPLGDPTAGPLWNGWG